ncbi:P-loop containing nucleoside triphosphate hydrolase protein [Meredithblackwellia eburnea MCA 4105]
MNFGAARAAAKKRKLAKEAKLEAANASTTAIEDQQPPQADGPPSKKLKKHPKERRTRTEHAGNLKWKSITLPSEFGFDEEGGLLELDEVEGVDIVYGEDGRLVFKVQDDEDPNSKPSETAKPDQLSQSDTADFISPFPDEDLSVFQHDDDSESQDEDFNDLSPQPQPKKGQEKKEKKAAAKVEQPLAKPAALEVLDDFDVEAELPEWSSFKLATPIFRALAELRFSKPTDIQARALSVEIGGTPFVDEKNENGDNDSEEEWGGIVDEEAPAVASPSTTTTDRDVVGVAQTGSGKTLAYGLPILSYIISHAQPSSSRLSALILAPTRELAIQVRNALSEVAVRINKPLPDDEQNSDPKVPKKRVKGRHISVVALTGGMSVEKQKRQLSRGADILVATPGRLWDLIGEEDSLAREIKGIKFLVIDEADRMIENGHFAELDNIVRLTRRKSGKDESEYVDDFGSASRHSKVDTLPPRPDMRTFVFSATMSKDLQRNLKKRHRHSKLGVPEDGMSSLEGGVVDSLKECKIECMLPEKDVYLYHFLIRYPGRTIVFLSSIDGIRRLHPLLQTLKVNAIALHSGMQQRARLKSLDRFKSATDAVLLATDVAARGLDIPSVSHVVHFNLPRSADVYVHRSGRTARAGQEGLALQLVAPEEKQVQRMLMASLGKDVDLPVLPTDFSILDKLKQRLELAKKIENADHKASKEAHDDNWLRQAAEAMEIDLDSDFEELDEDNNKKSSKKKVNAKAAKAKALKAELQALLDKPLMMRGVSAKYITTRGRVGFVDQLVNGTGHSSLLGIEASTALDDLPKPKKNPLKS